MHSTISAREAADASDTGGTLPVRSDVERAVLKELPSLPTGSPRQIMTATVVAQAPYAAASGKTCRAVQVKLPDAAQNTGRLACTQGGPWFFVPDVFGSPSLSE